jgi:hypothetical protein
LYGSIAADLLLAHVNDLSCRTGTAIQSSTNKREIDKWIKIVVLSGVCGLKERRVNDTASPGAGFSLEAHQSQI